MEHMGFGGNKARKSIIILVSFSEFLILINFHNYLQNLTKKLLINGNQQFLEVRWVLQSLKRFRYNIVIRNGKIFWKTWAVLLIFSVELERS